MLGYGFSLYKDDSINNNRLRNAFLFSGIAIFGIVIWLYVFIFFPYEEYDINKGRVSNEIFYELYNFPFIAAYEENNKWSVVYLPFIPSLLMWIGFQLTGWKFIFKQRMMRSCK
ncbi:hypothetical protein [Paenibacillus sp. FSL H7-0331]|uniref:hypothetical protein n=1 Tax=Paenibacillus sp. FSL H7-0331 TaxID=1920421 RepID=UPI00117C58AA|nr:hypothetical protein [Paenibacillus sp. FSL H7-0331]